MIRFLLKSNKGQTAIEYLMLIVCSVGLGIVFLKRMNEHIINNPNGIIGRPLTQFANSLNRDPSGRYQFYSLPTTSKKPQSP